MNHAWSVGGLIVSQTLTLYITPVVYLYFERFQEWLQRKKQVSEMDQGRISAT